MSNPLISDPAMSMEMLTTVVDSDFTGSAPWVDYGAQYADACKVGDGVMLVVCEYTDWGAEGYPKGKAARAFRWTDSGPEAGPLFTSVSLDYNEPHRNPPIQLHQVSDGRAWETFYASSVIDGLLPIGCEWSVDLSDLTITRGPAQQWAGAPGAWNSDEIVVCSSPGRVTMVIEVQWTSKNTIEMFVWDSITLTHAAQVFDGISSYQGDSPWNARANLGNLLDDGQHLYRIGNGSELAISSPGWWPALAVYRYDYPPGANSVSGAGTLVGEFTTVVNGDEGVYTGAVYACFVGDDYIDVAVPASYTDTWQPWYAGRIHKTTGANSGLTAGDLTNDEFYGYRQEYVQIVPWSDTESLVTALGSDPDTDGVGYNDPQGSAGRAFDGTTLGEQIAVMPFFFGEDEYSQALEAVAVGPGRGFTVFSGGYYSGTGPDIDEQIWVTQLGRLTVPVRLWPRDDARGLGAGPRLHPLSSSNRIVGGLQ